MLGGKRVLLIGGEGVVLYNPSGKGVDRETSISWEVPNFEAQLVEALAERNSSKSVVVLFDDADQAYKKEEIPSNIGTFDKPNYIKRKIGQLFPSHPIRAAMQVKPPKKKGGGLTLTKPAAGPVAYLFVALPELERLDVIGNALLESGVPVAGFGLLPVESEGLVSELGAKLFSKDGKKARWSVLIAQHETGGFRQVFVKDGNLAMTRLIRTTDANLSGQTWAEEVLKEFRASLAYIARIGFTPAEGLDLVIICGEIEKQFFDPKSLPVAGFRAMTVTEALKTIGAKSFGLEKSVYGDALHAAWVGRKNSLALPVRVPSIHRIMAPRLSARFATGSLVVAALGLAWFAFASFQEYSTIETEIAERQNQKIMLEREYADEAKVFDTLPVKPEIMKGALSVKKMLEQNTVDVAPTLNILKSVLGDDIHPSELRYEHKPNSAYLLGNTPGTIVKPAGADDRGSLIVTFKFSLPESMLLEQKVIRAEELQKKLEQSLPKYRVRIVSQFGNASRDGKMAGVLGEGAPSSAGIIDSAEFELEGAPL